MVGINKCQSPVCVRRKIFWTINDLRLVDNYAAKHMKS